LYVFFGFFLVFYEYVEQAFDPTLFFWA